MTADGDFQGGFFFQSRATASYVNLNRGLRFCGRVTHMRYTSFVSDKVFFFCCR